MNEPYDIAGRVCLVTGATSGHGRAVARALARAGGHVVISGRNPEKCESVKQEIRDMTGKVPEVLLCDLSSRRDIDRAARAFLAVGRPLHVLVNNAGLVNRTRQETHDGREMVFAVNYLAPFQLTLRLLPCMLESAPARIINVSSDTHRIVSLNLDDLEHRLSYSVMGSYGRSKLALVYFTLELAERLQGTGVTANAVDPGPVDSGIGQNNRGWAADVLKVVMKCTFPGADRAARTAVYLSCSPEAEGQTGGYYKYGRRRAPRTDKHDPSVGKDLWKISERLTRTTWR